MGLIKPDNGASIGTWGVENNASWDIADAHDHSSGKGVRVPVSGLNINTDLSLANFALTQIKALAMAPVGTGTVTALSRCLFVNSADNELYWKTSGGVLVQLTSGTSLNAALLGGFTGDYGTGGSAVNFNSGTSIYNFLRAANHRAFLDTSDIRLFQGTAGIANAVKLRSPNALASSYEIIFPPALPAATRLLSLSSGGQVDASGSAVQSGDLAVTGTTTAQGAVVQSGIQSTPVTTSLNNLALTATTSILRADPVGGANALTGMTGGTDGRLIEIWNVDAANSFDINNEDTDSTAANRFITQGGSALTIGPGQRAVARYFSADTRWRAST
jgi:hypothetical protein